MSVRVDSSRYASAIFDLDGVVTDTASLHFAAWERAFGELLVVHRVLAPPSSSPARFTRDDYRTYVDGRPREDGVASFLASRSIEMRRGEPSDAPGLTSVWAIANLKSSYFDALLSREGPRPYASTVGLIEEMRRRAMTTAVVTASRNCARILEAGHLEHLFDARVDGVDIEKGGLAGKPDPATFLEAVGRLGVAPPAAVVFEDAVAGVEAGAAGGFGLVVGIDRYGSGDLAGAGADAVVADLAEVTVF